jgi:exodeoxyribonuclease (lambda-induced)
MKLHTDIEQRSPEWHAIRKGKLTASNATAIGNSGKGLETLVYTLLAEKYSKAEPEHYENDDILRGIQLEEAALAMYSADKDKQIQRVAFVEIDKYTGFSPDGFIDDNSIIEVKCPNDKNYFKLLINGEKEIDSSYRWQIQMQLLLSDREYCDLVFYNPNFDKDLLIFRILPDKEMQELLRTGLDKGVKMIKEIEKKYLNNK